MPNFEVLQWITLRNRVSDLSALNLGSRSFKGSIFFFAFGGNTPQNSAHPFRKSTSYSLIRIQTTGNPSSETFF